MRIPLDDIEEYPPFDGFPKEGISFLRKLKRNNTRDWFAEHKHEYEAHVKLPMQSLIVALRPHFDKFAPAYDLNPKRALFRIYRDTRFSNDKTPYKTHVAAHFVLRGAEKGLVGSGYYLHIEPGECFLGGGIYMPDGEQLKLIRASIAARGDELLSIVRNRAFVDRYGDVQGERLKRIPKGYREDDPMAEWLKLKQFFVGVSLPEKSCSTASFVRTAASYFSAAAPFVRFLNSAR